MTDPVVLQAFMSLAAVEVFDLTFSPDGQQLVTYGSNGISLWDVQTGEEQGLGLDTWVTCLDYNPDGHMIAAGTIEGHIILWDPSTGHEIRRWAAHPFKHGDDEGVSCLKFSHDGQLLVSGGLDTTIKLWEVSTGHLQKTLVGHVGQVNSLVLSPDAAILISVDVVDDQRLWGEESLSDSWVMWHTDAMITWDTSLGREERRLKPPVGIITLALHPDKEFVVSGNDDGSISLWKILTGEMIASYRKHSDTVHAVAFSPDGTLFASGGGRREHALNLWRTSDWEVLFNDSRHDASVVGLAFSPDGNLLASTTSEEIILWKIGNHSA